MKLLVTGASGFIGRNLLLKAPADWKIYGIFFSSEDFLDFLKENNLKNVTPIRCNLTDFQDVQGMAKRIGKHFDVILYLAGNTSPRESVTNPLFDMESNINGMVNFLENFSCDKFIFFSSGAVYDGLKGRVSPESRVSPTLPYAISKLTAENYIRFYHEHKSIGNYVILRFLCAYGPYEPSRKIYTKLVKAFAMEGKKEFTVFGNGNNYIDAMYVDDTVEGIKKVIDTKLEKSVTLDFGTGKPITINELVREAARIFGVSDVEIKHSETTASERISFQISPREMEKLFSFKPGIKLEEGLPKLAQHLKANPGSYLFPQVQ